MDWFRELKISNKLYLLVALASVFIIITSTIGYVFNDKSSIALDKMYNQNLVAISNLQQIRGNINALLVDVLELFQYTTPEETNLLTSDIKAKKDSSTQLMAEFLTTNPSQEQKDKLESFKGLRDIFWSKLNASIELAKQNKNDQAYAIFKSNQKNVEAYKDTLIELINLQKKSSKNIYEENEKSTQTAMMLLAIIGVASLLLMVSLGITIAHEITKPIQRAIGELTTGSAEVSAASSQVETASHSLAEGTTEQAASIQETSSTLEETASMVQQNNENTKQAAILAKKAKDYAEKSNNEMTTMMQSMEDLKVSSNEISKIMKVIDEIAFQTNILSLNAAVEAARAGDAGKGFAVVAEEVRNLAQRSANAAKDTASIIEKNIILSTTSADLAKDVNESLTQIDTESRKVAELLEEISTATEEQSRGISEINKAIQQMEVVIQSNAATADESAAASAELSSQAENVNDIVSSLIRLVEGANAKFKSSSIARKPKPVQNRLTSIEPRSTVTVEKHYTPSITTHKDKHVLIEWSQAYSVGVAEMDNQHMQLVSILNDLYAAMQTKKTNETIGKILTRLVSYTKKHFSEEEELLKKHSYPQISSQKKEHKGFTDKIQKFKDDYEAGRTSISVSITSFLKDWLMHHISISDKKYGTYINNTNVSLPSVQTPSVQARTPESIIPLGDDF